MTFQLLYRSKSTHPRGHLSDLDILRTAQASHHQSGLTGCLLRLNRAFEQLIEGEEPVVRALFSRIACDPRHFDIKVLHMGQAKARRCAQWHMGYCDTGLSPADLQRAPGADRHGLLDPGDVARAPANWNGTPLDRARHAMC